MNTVPLTSNVATPMPHGAGAIIAATSGQSISSLDPEEVKSLFTQTGAISFRGFECSTAEFVTLSELFSTHFSSYDGGVVASGPFGREVVEGNRTLLTTSGGGSPLPVRLHGEFYYVKHPPRLLWFYCSVPPRVQGETTICDGRRICENLSAESLNFWREHNIRYIRLMKPDQWQGTFGTHSVEEVQARCSEDGATIETDDEANLRIEFVTSALRLVNGREVFINSILPFYYMERAFVSGDRNTVERLNGTSCPLTVRMEDGSPLPKSRVSEVRKAADNFTVAVSWAAAGDILMIDNQTHLHGRLQSDLSERLIYMRMGHDLNMALETPGR